MRKKRRPRATSICPQCGGEFPSGRPACPHCGSDAETGWSDPSDDDYSFTDEDYGDVVAGLPGREKPRSTWSKLGDDLDELIVDPDAGPEDALYGRRWQRRRRWVALTGLAIVMLFVFYLLLYGSSNW